VVTDRTIVLIVREDKAFDDGPRRRESAIEVAKKDFMELCDTLLAWEHKYSEMFPPE